MQDSRTQIRFMLFCGAMLIFFAVVGGIVALVLLLSEDQDDHPLIERNGGRGSEAQPIGSNAAIYFSDQTVTPICYIRPATDLVRSFFPTNTNPNAGAEYILIRLRINCTTSEGDTCHAGNIETRLIDDQGREFGRPRFIRIQDNLDDTQIISGGTGEGYKLVEFPQDRPIRFIKLWLNSRQPLYAQPPPICP